MSQNNSQVKKPNALKIKKNKNKKQRKCPIVCPTVTSL